jgi:heme/copper-type cytochrome/quinol oxidase subunit 2
MPTNSRRILKALGNALVADGILLLAGAALPETVTLPVAASVVGAGGVPFVSDVRVFNTSYTDVLTVTAVYRFGGQPQIFPLAPREAKAFDDICVSLFGTPNSLGAIEFTSTAAAGSLVVTSQLRSPVSDGGHVGMFIPGLPQSGAHAVSVLTGLVNGDSRTNVGVYNPNEVSVTATIRLFDGPVLLGTQAVGLAAHGVTQVNNIYGVVGFGSLVRTDGYATVESDNAAAPLFTYAAEADNRSGDLILIIGADDSVAPTGFNPPTATVTSAPSEPTGTPTPPPATVTPTPTVTPTAPAAIAISLVATQFQWTFSGDGASGPELVVRVGQTCQLQISDGDRAGTTAHGFSGIPSLALSALSLTAGGPPKTLTFKPTAGQIGTSFFSCSESNCGTGHDNMLGTIQVVNP